MAIWYKGFTQQKLLFFIRHFDEISGFPLFYTCFPSFYHFRGICDVLDSQRVSIVTQGKWPLVLCGWPSPSSPNQWTWLWTNTLECESLLVSWSGKFKGFLSCHRGWNQPLCAGAPSCASEAYPQGGTNGRYSTFVILLGWPAYLQPAQCNPRTVFGDVVL